MEGNRPFLFMTMIAWEEGQHPAEYQSSWLLLFWLAEQVTSQMQPRGGPQPPTSRLEDGLAGPGCELSKWIDSSIHFIPQMLLRRSAVSGGGLVALATALPGSQSNGSHPNLCDESNLRLGTSVHYRSLCEAPTLNGGHHTSKITKEWSHQVHWPEVRSYFRF